MLTSPDAVVSRENLKICAKLITLCCKEYYFTSITFLIFSLYCKSQRNCHLTLSWAALLRERIRKYYLLSRSWWGRPYFLSRGFKQWKWSIYPTIQSLAVWQERWATTPFNGYFWPTTDRSWCDQFLRWRCSIVRALAGSQPFQYMCSLWFLLLSNLLKVFDQVSRGFHTSDCQRLTISKAEPVIGYLPAEGFIL